MAAAEAIFACLKQDRHHIEEEEDEHFPDFAKYLTKEAEVTPERMEEAKE